MAEAELEMSRSQESVDDQGIESPETKAPIEPVGDISATIIRAIESADGGQGAEYDSIILECVQSGFSREDAEDAIEGMRDVDGTIIEPRFGFFQSFRAQSRAISNRQFPFSPLS